MLLLVFLILLLLLHCYCCSCCCCLFVVGQMQVKDETGNPLGKVKVGDSKAQALQRLSRTGALFDKDNIGLLDTDTITTDGGPYTFRESTTKDAGGLLVL